MSLARIPRAIWHDLRFYLLESLALVALMGITAAMFYAHRVAAVDSHFGLQIHQPFIEDFKEEVATWALAWWLIAAVPLIVVAARARGARSSEQSIRNILAKNQVQLLQAERLARIGYWQWNAGSERLFLSPQAAVMSGLREGAQQMSLAARPIPRSLGTLTNT
jgi:hypothetical protein